MVFYSNQLSYIAVAMVGFEPTTQIHTKPLVIHLKEVRSRTSIFYLTKQDKINDGPLLPRYTETLPRFVSFEQYKDALHTTQTTCVVKNIFYYFPKTLYTNSLKIILFFKIINYAHTLRSLTKKEYI